MTDNLKSAVIKSDRYEPTLNEAFRDFTLHYGISALPAGPYKPRHKALAEGMVKIIYRVIYPVIKQQRYTSLQGLNQRDMRPFRYTTVAEHLASSHKYITDWTLEKFIARAEKIGTNTQAYVQKVLDKPQHAEQAYRSCQGIINLAKRVGNERLDSACARADYFGEYSYKTVKTILDRLVHDAHRVEITGESMRKKRKTGN